MFKKHYNFTSVPQISFRFSMYLKQRFKMFFKTLHSIKRLSVTRAAFFPTFPERTYFSKFLQRGLSSRYDI